MQAFSTKQTSTRTRFARWQKHITLLAGDRGNWNERQAQTGEDLQQRTQIQAERKTKRRWLNLRTRPQSYGRQLLMTGPDGLKLKTEKRTGRRAPLLCCGNQIRKSTGNGGQETKLAGEPDLCADSKPKARKQMRRENPIRPCSESDNQERRGST
jgi:hypothetical protein